MRLFFTSLYLFQEASIKSYSEIIECNTLLTLLTQRPPGVISILFLLTTSTVETMKFT